MSRGNPAAHGTLVCEACEAGSYATPEDECELCPWNKKNTVPTSNECADCPEGTAKSLSGTSCMSCTTGQYYHMASQTCMECAAGTYQPEANVLEAQCAAYSRGLVYVLEKWTCNWTFKMVTAEANFCFS